MNYLAVYIFNSKGCEVWIYACSEIFKIYMQVCFLFIVYICRSSSIIYHINFVIIYWVCWDPYIGVVHGKRVLCIRHIYVLGFVELLNDGIWSILFCLLLFVDDVSTMMICFRQCGLCIFGFELKYWLVLMV